MHIFLQGPRNIGKSTVIEKTLDILTVDRNIMLGGFFTWNDGKSDPCIYMRPAALKVGTGTAADAASGTASGTASGEAISAGAVGESFILARYSAEKGGLVRDSSVFDTVGVSLLRGGADADLIIMDELGFLEDGSPLFMQAVMDTIAGHVPVLGVLRLGDVPWHAQIKRDPSVTLYDVGLDNRDALPAALAAELGARHGL